MLKLKKRLCMAAVLIISVILLIPEIVITALADESTSDLFNYDEEKDIAVIIEYQNDDISFTITSPSGDTIDKNTDTDNVTVFCGSTSTIVFIGSAEAGQWTITYDKGSNEYLTVRSVVQNSDFWITDFKTDTLTESALPVAFNVSGAENTHYTYSLMAVTSVDTLSGRELASGNASVNTEVEVQADLSDLSSYSEYYLLLYVSFDDNGTEIFDYAYSDSFSYTNPNSPDVISGIDITIAHDSRSITADWSDYISYNTESVYVEYYLDDALISSAEYDTSTAKYGFFTYEDEKSDVTFKISVRSNRGIASDLAEFNLSIVPDNSLKLTLTESGTVDSDIWSFDYTDGDNTEVTFTVNDDTFTQILDGSGSSFITLPELRNTVMVSYTDANGYVHTYNRMANITSITPYLTLSRSIDGITTSNDYIIISGATNCSDVTVNGNAAKVISGTFTYVLDLEEGENLILIEAASGELGTSLTATVTREAGSILSSESLLSTLLPLICGLIISVLGIILILIFTRKRRKKKEAKNNISNDINDHTAKNAKKSRKKTGALPIFLLVICWLVTVGLWVWFIVRKVFENSVGYIELAYQSLSKADSYLTHTVILLIFAIIAASASVIFTVILILIRRHKRKK